MSDLRELTDRFPAPRKSETGRTQSSDQNFREGVRVRPRLCKNADSGVRERKSPHRRVLAQNLCCCNSHFYRLCRGQLHIEFHFEESLRVLTASAISGHWRQEQKFPDSGRLSGRFALIACFIGTKPSHPGQIVLAIWTMPESAECGVPLGTPFAKKPIVSADELQREFRARDKV